ncbi:MAG TPA: hypothetical protein CFH79_09970 [Sulfurospirillum sp. UBA11407]|nr:MAG TPA: hypothetical protein CFH79_09970 [Sulfurospirillum sp. UBA11407]
MLKLLNVTCFYDEKTILEDICFEAHKGSIISILGANGCGKSTLLKAISGLIPHHGKILLQGQDTQNLSQKQRAKLLSYVPQNSSLPFDYLAKDIVLMGRFHESSFGFQYSKEDWDITKESLDLVGASHLGDKIYKHLSGGQKQLILIARAIAQQSGLIVMDEPVTGLDLQNQMRLLHLIKKLAYKGHTIIQTTHYPDHALRISDEVIWIDNQKIIASGKSKETITPQRIQEIYHLHSEIYQDSQKQSHLVALDFIHKDKHEPTL